jgi:hypothetical protein
VVSYTFFHQIPFQRDVECERVCQAQKLTPEQVATLRQRIRDQYRVHWFVYLLSSFRCSPYLQWFNFRTLDGLPAAHEYRTIGGDLRWETGFPLGKVRLVDNHRSLNVVLT